MIGSSQEWSQKQHTNYPPSNPSAFFLMGVFTPQNPVFGQNFTKNAFWEKKSRTRVIGRKISYRIVYLKFSLRFMVVLPRDFKVGLQTARNKFFGKFFAKYTFWVKKSQTKVVVRKISYRIVYLMFSLRFMVYTHTYTHTRATKTGTL